METSGGEAPRPENGSPSREPLCELPDARLSQRALKARPVAAAMLGAPLKARVREVLRRRTDLFEKVKPKKAPAADGDGGGAAPKKAVRWTVAATSPLAATSGAPAPSENSTRQ